MALHHQREHDFGVALGVFLSFAKGSYQKKSMAHLQFELLEPILTREGNADGLAQRH